MSDADFRNEVVITEPSNIEAIERAIREKEAISRKRNPLHWYDTGVAATIKTFKPGAPHKLLEIRFKTTALAAGEDLTITKTNTNPTNLYSTYHDVILLKEELGDLGTTNLVRTFDADEGFMTEDDSIVSALSANTGGDRWGMEIVYELV